MIYSYHSKETIGMIYNCIEDRLTTGAVVRTRDACKQVKARGLRMSNSYVYTVFGALMQQMVENKKARKLRPGQWRIK